MKSFWKKAYWEGLRLRLEVETSALGLGWHRMQQKSHVATSFHVAMSKWLDMKQTIKGHIYYHKFGMQIWNLYF